MCRDDSESELIRQACAGDRSSLSQLLLVHHDGLKRHIAGRITKDLQGLVSADDILHQTFVRVAQSVRSFEPRHAGAFRGWLHTIADNLVRDVAIKVPHRHRITDPAAVTAYLTEARIVAGMDHPSIVPVYDVGRMEDGSCYVVSKLIRGTNLAERIGESRLSSSEAVRLGIVVADALQHAHSNGLVHRDVKPANILLDAQGKPFITDFGLALQEADPGLGRSFAGTPAYMSPEQARGESHRVDGRSDVFSLGVVLYELLTGNKPFCSAAYDDLLQQIIWTDPIPPRKVDESVPAELERICLKSLSKRAADRYPTMADLTEDLRHFIERGGSEAARTTAAGRAPVDTRVAPGRMDSPVLRVVPRGAAPV